MDDADTSRLTALWASVDGFWKPFLALGHDLRPSCCSWATRESPLRTGVATRFLRGGTGVGGRFVDLSRATNLAFCDSS